MERIYKPFWFKNAGLYIRYGLAFFLFTIVAACKRSPEKIELVWAHDVAVAITIPKQMLKDASVLRAAHSVKVVLANRDSRLGILGDFTTDDGTVVFKPVIPLSRGLSYDIWQDGRLVGTIAVPLAKGALPVVAAVYPEADTVPENLLKIYIRFSHPMRTGMVLDYVYLLDKNRDTMKRVFLNLQPELWDKLSRTVTLWLDPGRIKRDLVLNRQLGNPLKKMQSYQLVISGDWKDERGLPLGRDYIKRFTVAERDSVIPDISKWQLTSPKAGSKDVLKITTGEPLDHFLLYDSAYIIDDHGAELQGDVSVGAKDKVWLFAPKGEWDTGRYRLKVYSRLEDLAGNNLNRVFDRDIRKDKQQNKDYFVREFEVGN
ncbi:hypothetical protein HQ865_05255 [Mucilaginibacter mali]|uniref:SbsA Ig-like domain-containing protein n=1 Tax=Mucilaginibacter mali TaxID=2740462 RepID=A0A7D4PSW4_9SPHI|nr:hypothetical protein [Mucilaginibacter mali]QKJ29183.1 hypothetical protein HQ865_05255 [Mucilaginibacter mali]